VKRSHGRLGERELRWREERKKRGTRTRQRKKEKNIATTKRFFPFSRAGFGDSSFLLAMVGGGGGLGCERKQVGEENLRKMRRREKTKRKLSLFFFLFFSPSLHPN
jgi:hypothetical protein